MWQWVNGVPTFNGSLGITGLAKQGSAAIGGAPGDATTSHRFTKKVTGIADAAATDILTVTVPNANHEASILFTILSSNGSTDAFEAARTTSWAVVLTRTAGVATVAVASAVGLS